MMENVNMTPNSLQDIKDRALGFMVEAEWEAAAPLIEEILALKKQRNAVILAHNYMTRDIFHTVADVVGDSLQLAIEATKTKADVIVQCGVHFMAETSKILNPGKVVLLPSLEAGCSLASSITAHQVRAIRKKHPGSRVVTYVNTSADVKAVSDVCCTSSNALAIVEAMDSQKVIFLPDQYLAKNIAAKTRKTIVTWAGSCEVHERFTGEDIKTVKQANPGIKVLVHPECPPEVIAEADFAGSTAKLIDFVKEHRPEQVALITECSMASNIAAETPDIAFVQPCHLCPHMQEITLTNIRDALRDNKHVVEVDEQIAADARKAVERMIELSQPKAS
ncbi:MAG: quinolinate synthase [Rhodobacteraceae bacterium]|nr:quinolinate synthase [Paracoccaceae bacterium]